MYTRLAVGVGAVAIATFAVGHYFFGKKKSEDIKLQETKNLVPKNTAMNMRNLLEYARYAPSPHNMQPWLFQINTETEATLLYDPKRLLPDTNPEGSYVVVGFGMLLETMDIACDEMSRQQKSIKVEFPPGEVKLNANAQTPQILGKLSIVDNPLNHESKKITSTLGLAEILNRRTSRQHYNGQPVPESFLNGELSSVASHFNHTMKWTNQKTEVDWVVRLNAKAMLSDMCHEKTRYEIRNWLRYSKYDAETRADGLAAYTMNTSGWKLWLLVNANWALRLPCINKWALNTYQQTMDGTASVAWLSGPFSNFNDWILAGRMMMRWWLTMTKQGYYLHPFGSIITNPPAFQEMNQRFPNSDPSKPIWMVARIGKNKDDQKPPQAQRLPLEKMIINRSGFFASSSAATSDFISVNNLAPKL